MRLTVLIGIALALSAFQPAPVTVTVADCLLRSGYSRAVPETPVTTLAGVEAWANGGERVLIEGEQVGAAYPRDSDGTRRMVWFYVYAGQMYAFIFMHPDDPARRLPGEPAGVWHGECFLRVTGY